jgi:uncharacterized repeat protein (TIGR01451 family)
MYSPTPLPLWFQGRSAGGKEHSVLSLRVLLLLTLWAVFLSAWGPHSQTVHASQPTERDAPATHQAQGVFQEPAQHLGLAPASLAKVEPSLLKQVLEGNPADSYRFIVELMPKASLQGFPEEISRAERQLQVVTHLQTTAQQAQAELLAFLQQQQAAGRVEGIHPFWILNGIAVTADAETLLALAARPEVRIVREDHWRRWVDQPSAPDDGKELVQGSVEWNIARIRADLAWSALGLDGSGVTVAIMDTGVDWQHPALQAQYRGYRPGGLTIHCGNWFCTTDEGYLYPADGYGHGTHVAGTAVGGRDAAGQAIGVAPGARWIAVKTLNNQGYAYDSWIHAAFEWLMAPEGDPSLAPDVVNGSWGAPDDADETFRPDLQALRAAGIVPVFSAGNEGPGPSSLRSPASYPEAIAVGATDDLDQVTYFSSRGPSPWGEVKPEVAAPGAQVRSSLPGGTYGVYNGTSMASPHVTGLVALMLQADPDLTVDEIEAILTSTALPLSTTVPNNDSGWGRIDAYRAAAVAFQAGFVTGLVTRSPDQQPLSLAQVTAYDHGGEPQATVPVDRSGRYHLALPPGQYDLSASAFGYEPQSSLGVSIQANLTTTVDMVLVPSPAGVLWGQVTNAQTGGPVGARIIIEGTPAFTVSDPQSGQYSLVLPVGIYSVRVSQNGYRSYTVTDVEIAADQATRVDAVLAPAATLLLVDSGPWYYGSQASYFEQALDDRDYVYDLWQIRDPATDVPGLADLVPYQITIWSSPQDAPGLIGAGDAISNYLGLGGNLFLTGQDVGYWDDGLNGLYYHPYYGQWLKAEAIADDAGRGDVVGLPGELLQGLTLPMNGQDSARNQAAPDSIGLRDPRHAAILARYQQDGEAALRAGECQSYRAVYLAAGLEGLGDRSTRAEVMDRALSWLAAPHPAADVALYPAHQEQVWLHGTTITYTVEIQNTGHDPDQFALELSPSSWSTSVWDETFSHELAQTPMLGACQSQPLGIQVTVPPAVAWNVTDVVALTARSSADPGRTAQAVFNSRAPAPILLVDDDRWYDMEGRYEAALQANSLPYDRWTTRQPPLSDVTPTLQRLTRYPLVIWFTGYDWYRTLTPADEDRLAAYLDTGGRLLLSSQDYLYTSGFTDFARDYLGVVGYTESLTATQLLGAVGSPIGNGLGSLSLIYPFRNWSDALKASPAAEIAFWGQHAQPAALTVEGSPWKIAFFALPLEALLPEDMALVLGRIVDWLSPLGDSSLEAARPVAAPGEEIGYTLAIRNTSSSPLSSVSLSNTVPISTSYVPGSLEGPAEYDSLTNRFTWSGGLAANETITVAYRLQSDASLSDGAKIRNLARLTDESGLGLDRIAATRINTPHLATSVKTASTELGTPGQVLTYTLFLHNDGLRPAPAQLIDPTPLYATSLPGSAWASSGLLTSTLEALFWSGSISVGQPVTLSFPVVISPTLTGRYVLNRASLADGWGDVLTLEAHTWVAMRLFLPLVLKRP